MPFWTKEKAGRGLGFQEREMTASRTFSGKACALVWRGGFSEQVAFRLRPDGQMSFGGLQPKVGTF